MRFADLQHADRQDVLFTEGFAGLKKKSTSPSRAAIVKREKKAPHSGAFG